MWLTAFRRPNRVRFFSEKFFASARPCSHLYAVLLLLADLNNPKLDMMLVRRSEVLWHRSPLSSESRIRLCQSRTKFCDCGRSKRPAALWLS
jgi:hypothetical protein